MFCLHEIGYELQSIASTMENDTATKTLCKSWQSLKPTIETRLKFGTRWYGYLKGTQGVQGNDASGNDDLTIKWMEDALCELSPELTSRVIVDMLSEDDLRAIVFLESMVYTIGYVRC